jgi:predicted nucleotidyltransferase
VFGSLVRDDFDPARSDVDVLAEFAPGALQGVGWDYFSYGDELGEILGRRVDICSRLNKYIWPLVKDELTPIYEQA